MSWRAERGGATGFNCAKSPVKDIGRWLNEAVVLELRASAGRPPASGSLSDSIYLFFCIYMCVYVCVCLHPLISAVQRTLNHITALTQGSAC